MIDTTNIPLPHSVQFAEKWVEWVNYRKEIKKSYKTKRGVTMALNTLGAVTEQEAIKMIDSSMENEYQGLFAQKKEKGETDKTYTTPKPKELSNYQSTNTPTEEQRDTFIKGKIKLAYEGKIHLNDHGSVYTNRLEKFFNTPPLIKDQINQAVKELDELEPSNRFEEVVEINVDLEIRNRILRFNIKNWSEQKREIHKEL